VAAEDGRAGQLTDSATITAVQFVILGGGAIGSVCAAKLSERHDVTLVGRPAHVRAIQQQGLVLSGAAPGVFRVSARLDLDGLPPGAVILLTTKVGDSRAALTPHLPRLDPSHTLVCLQNGLDADRMMRELVANRAPVLRAIVQFGAVLSAPGHVNFTVPGFVLFEAHERTAPIASAFTAVGLDGRVTADIKREVWRKVIFNCLINPTTTIVGCEVGGITAPGLAPLNRLVLDECLAVAHADGVDFDEDLLAVMAEIYGPSRTVVSMRQDIERGRPTEIDHLNGAVVARGRALGIACPVNEALTAIVKALEGRSA
jgi:2-dehydropantoate 2-reductase